MAQQSLTTTSYHDIGVYLPYYNAGRGNQWSHEEKLHDQGFLLVEARSRNEFVVQSVGNGKLYVNKLLEGGGKDFVGPRPPELKVSTAAAEGGKVFGVGYAGDPHNQPPPDRSNEPGWWRPEDSDASVVTDCTQSSKEDEETDYGEGDDWIPQQEEDGDVSIRGDLRGGAGSQDLIDNDDDDDTTKDGETQEEYERRTRDLEVVLPADEEGYRFTKLRFWQKLENSEGDPVFSLYFEHGNGGSLADLINVFRARRRRVPEHFIWHVCEQLGSALAHLHGQSKPRRDTDYDYPSDSECGEEETPTEIPKKAKTIYHRDLFAKNVSIHYKSPKSDPKPRGERTEAFPEIQLGGFGRAYIEGDPIEKVRPRAWDSDSEDAFPEEWEDIAGLGTILRELATTHVDLLPTWGDETNQNGSESRANRIRVADANTGKSAGAIPKDPQKGPYSDSLIKVLERFEWKGMTDHPDLRICDERPDGSFGHDDLPTMVWVVHRLLPEARERRQFRDRFNEWPRAAAGELYGYGTLDVSWTKPPRLMPFTCSSDPSSSSAQDPAQQRLKRAQSLLKELWDDVHGGTPYEFVKIEFPAPKVTRVESGKRKGDPEREKLPPHLEAALRENRSTHSLASSSSSSRSENDDGDTQGGVKRARHSY
ncbi:hypothetical protein PG996_006189 [Apiospora saccharicola]|uniref:Protein kinase domain-containing protein n=1 Tax=Apiospora saccharicola TaxID=335842 RepID=A0ABR1VNL1_9PEZI